jgi:hypothetical protein
MATSALRSTDIFGSAIFDANLRPNSNSVGTGSFGRSIVQDLVREWKPGVSQRLQELVRLPVGWDGYRGLPTRFEVAAFAYRVLESVCTSRDPEPQIVPGADGDLQIEWHLEGGDIELLISAPNNAHAWKCASESGETEEHRLGVDFTVVARWLSEMKEVDGSAQAAAAGH